MEQKRITLRIPMKLYDKLVDSTELSGKTITGEILERVNATYKNSDQTLTASQVRKLIKEELSKK